MGAHAIIDHKGQSIFPFDDSKQLNQDWLVFTGQFVAKEPWDFNENGDPTTCLFRFMSSRAVGMNAPYVALDIFLPIDPKHCFLDGLGGLNLFDRPNSDWFDIFVRPMDLSDGEDPDAEYDSYRYISDQHTAFNQHDYTFQSVRGENSRWGYLTSNRKLHMFDDLDELLFRIQIEPHDEWSDI